MRKRTLLQSSAVGKPIENANYADICFYDKEMDNKVIVDANEFTAEAYPLSRFTPIGVVAVPSSHTDEKRPRIVSLADMNCNKPDNGTLIKENDEYVEWGGESYILDDLKTNMQCPYLSPYSNEYSIQYIGGSVYFPSDYFIGMKENILNTNEGFMTNAYSYFMCSPYKQDNTKEWIFFDENELNIFLDFEGENNTKIILEFDNSSSTDWQTANTIGDGAYEYTHPAAQCTWRYHTDGTKQGEWYLPSVGELVYCLSKQKAIDETITLINSSYNNILGLILYSTSSSTYFSSNQGNRYNAYAVSFYDGYVDKVFKSSTCDVRAFLKV